jgi:hypothetical protein
MLEYFSSALVRQYGLRDGIVLSGVCAISAADEDAGAAGTTELRKKYFYLTKEQVRRALESLVRAGAIHGEKPDGFFSRELQYRASADVVRQYFTDMTKISKKVKA